MISIYNRYKKTLVYISILLLVTVGAVFYGRTSSKISTDELAKKEAVEVKKMLSKHLVLPEGEEPDIRKIHKKLEDPFFVNAEIGDYLIIFYKSRIAYTYSPSQDLITNAGVVFINPQQATTTDK